MKGGGLKHQFVVLYVLFTIDSDDSMVTRLFDPDDKTVKSCTCIQHQRKRDRGTVRSNLFLVIKLEILVATRLFCQLLWFYIQKISAVEENLWSLLGRRCRSSLCHPIHIMIIINICVELLCFYIHREFSRMENLCIWIN